MAKDKKQLNKQKLAEAYYFDTDFDQKEIAELLDVSEQTMSRWVNDGNWKVKKASYKINPGNLLAMLYEQCFLIQEKAKNANRPLDAKEADAISKLAAAIERINKRISPSTIIHVLIDFNNWLRAFDLDLVKKLVDYQREYLSERIKDGR